MAKVLRDLLDAEEPIFSLSVQQLERATGQHGTDARLIGEIAEKMRIATDHIGLDPRDTTDRELYRGMLTQIARDNERVTKLIGGSDPDDVKANVPLMVKAVEAMNIDRSCWVLKRSVAKKLLTTYASGW